MFLPVNKAPKPADTPDMPVWIAGIIWSLLFGAASLLLISLFA